MEAMLPDSIAGSSVGEHWQDSHFTDFLSSKYGLAISQVTRCWKCSQQRQRTSSSPAFCSFDFLKIIISLVSTGTFAMAVCKRFSYCVKLSNKDIHGS